MKRIKMSIRDYIKLNEEQRKSVGKVTFDINDYISLDGVYRQTLTKKDLYDLSSRFAIPAYNRRTDLLKFISDNNPTPNILSNEYSKLDKDTNTRVGIERKYEYGTESFSPKKDMSLSELRNLVNKQILFLSAKTSTVSGWKNVLSKFYTNLKDAYDKIGINFKRVELNDEGYKKLWQVYNRIEQEYKETNLDSHQIVRMIYDVIIKKDGYNVSIDDLIKEIEKINSPTNIYETLKSKEEYIESYELKPNKD